MAQTIPQTGLVAWWRADDYTSGDWPDRTANGYDMSEATNPPSAVSDGGAGFANKPVVRLNGSSQWISRASTPALSQPITIVTIRKLTLSNASSKVLLSADSGANFNLDDQSSEVHLMRAGSNLAGTTNVLNQAVLQECFFNGSSSAIRLNSVVEASGNAGTNGMTGIRVGRYFTTPDLWWGGDIAEIAIYDQELTHAQRSQWAAYAAGRYGFAVPFPQTEAPSETGLTTAGTTMNVNIPAVEEGQLLLVRICANDDPSGSGGTISAPDATWAEVFQTQFATGGGGNAYAMFAKVVTADAGSTTAAFTFSRASTAAAQAHKVSLWSGKIARGVEAGTTAGEMTSSNPNPPSLTPSWGSDNTLWFAEAGYVDDDATVNSYPSSYTGGADTTSGAGTNSGAGVGSAWRQNATATEDPGTFTLSQSEAWLAQTVAVRPVLPASAFTPQLPLLGVG